jgi:hypothetical protein
MTLLWATVLTQPGLRRSTVACGLGDNGAGHSRHVQLPLHRNPGCLIIIGKSEANMPAFNELPFNSRPDLTPYLLHMTKNTKADDACSAFDNLLSILRTGEIWGSDSRKGFIKGPNKAVCFMTYRLPP